MMQFWKKALWAAMLTAAFAVSATGCTQSDTTGDTSTTKADTTTVAEEVADEETTTQMSEGSFAYTVNDDGTISITGYSGSETTVNVPDTIDGYMVSAIADHCFEANWDITTVTLPNGLSTIGESAFMDCGSLREVSIPETVGTIRRAAFASCSSLTEISVPASVTEIMEEAFTGCAGLETLTIANPDLQYESWGLIEGSEPLTCTIICPSGSAIETWANENEFTTQALS